MRKFLLGALLALIGTKANAELINAGELKSLWSSWKQLNNKVYSEGEELTRFAVFVENYIKVQTHNAKGEDVKLALNQFADLTADEWKAKHVNGLNTKEVVKSRNDTFLGRSVDYSLLALPTSVDWRAKGAVTPVKNSLLCGSAWAFSTTGALEALNFIKNGQLLSFSEQQLIDCDGDNLGCNGGFAPKAFSYTAQKGIETEGDYPYTSIAAQCSYNAANAHHVNAGSKNIAANNADALKAAIAANPVAIGLEADQSVFQFYKSGVISQNCGSNIDHTALAVGYTTVDGKEAIIVKNSWGATWGDQGYVYISTDGQANNGQGVCGILAIPSVPTAN